MAAGEEARAGRLPEDEHRAAVEIEHDRISTQARPSGRWSILATGRYSCGDVLRVLPGSRRRGSRPRGGRPGDGRRALHRRAALRHLQGDPRQRRARVVSPTALRLTQPVGRGRASSRASQASACSAGPGSRCRRKVTPAFRGGLTAVKVTLRPGKAAKADARFSPDIPGSGRAAAVAVRAEGVHGPRDRAARRWHAARAGHCRPRRSASTGRCPCGRSQPRSAGGSRQDRVHDRRVAGAAAEVARELGADLLLGRVRVLLEEEPRRHQDPRRAEPALEAEVLVEGLLERVERRAVRERLDRLDLVRRPPGRRASGTTAQAGRRAAPCRRRRRRARSRRACRRGSARGG